jgi:hypothetical protein
MAIFKENPMKATTRDRDAAQANCTRLVTKLTAAEQAVIARRNEAQQLAIDAADDAALDKAEAALRGALDRQGTINAASAEAAKLLALLESRLAEMHDRETRAKTAAEVGALATDLESVSASFDVAVTELAEVSERAKRYCIDASGLVSFAGLAKEQVPTAITMICAMLRAHAVGLTAAPVVAPQYKKLFCLQPVRWLDLDGKQCTAQRFMDCDLPASLVPAALRSGAACGLDDPRRKTNHGTVIGLPDLKSCVNLNAAEPATAAQPRREQSHESGPLHSAYEPIESPFTILDRGPAVQMKVARNAS